MTRSIDLILASASPRRAELLKRLGLAFAVVPSHIDEEERPGFSPAETVLRLARDKARAFLQHPAGDGSRPRLVVAADTVIEFEGQLVGKPRDEADAASMLMRLSARRHRVLTAVCILETGTGRTVASVVRSEVTMRSYTREEALRYASTGEPLDKAGSYAIQGAGSELIDGWSGCYNNIVGLPICEVARLILHFASTASVRPDSCRLPGGPVCPRLSEPPPPWILQSGDGLEGGLRP